MKRVLAIALMLFAVTAFASWAQPAPSTPDTEGHPIAIKNCSGWSNWLKPACYGKDKREPCKIIVVNEQLNIDNYLILHYNVFDEYFIPTKEHYQCFSPDFSTNRKF